MYVYGFFVDIRYNKYTGRKKYRKKDLLFTEVNL